MTSSLLTHLTTAFSKEFTEAMKYAKEIIKESEIIKCFLGKNPNEHNAIFMSFLKCSFP